MTADTWLATAIISMYVLHRGRATGNSLHVSPSGRNSNSHRMHPGQQQQQQQQQPTVSTKRKNEENLAITLVSISILFIVCQSVKMIADIYDVFCEKKLTQEEEEAMCETNQFVEIAISLANLSTCVNSAANFLIYMLRGKKFRDLFLEIYCCRNQGKRLIKNIKKKRQKRLQINPG